MRLYDTGVQKVDADIESGEITVTGKFDSKEIHTHIEKLSKKKVEMASIKTIKVDEKETEKVSINVNLIEFSIICACDSGRNKKYEKTKTKKRG